MKTENLNSASEKMAKKDSKKSKIGEAAGKAAQFAAAAGVGIAGTKATEAFAGSSEGESDENYTNPLSNDEDALNIEDLKESDEEILVFDPNDIRLEDVEEIVLEEDSIEAEESGVVPEDLAFVEELEPITGENLEINDNDIAMINEDEVVVVDLDPLEETIDFEPFENMGTETGDTIDYDFYNDQNILLADDNIGEDPDILNDILNA